MKKVLILSYYWPPCGGSGVQRWLRFVRHLRNFGWEPIVYVPENAEYPVLDEALVRQVPTDIEVWKHPINEPHAWMSSGKKKDKNKEKNYAYRFEAKTSRMAKFKNWLSWFVRANLFIPDARMLWIKPSVGFLSRKLETEKVDAIVSTGPPHSLHLIAHALQKRFGIKWVADFRDPWTSMDYYQEMPILFPADKMHRYLERKVLTQANKVVVVAGSMKKEYKDNYNVDCELIMNGYDETIVGQSEAVNLDEKFSILHMGSFYKNRNCNDLWRVLQKLSKENAEFASKLEIKLVGHIDGSVLQSIEKHQLNAYLNRIEYIPFSETDSHLRSAQVLLLPIDRIPNAEFVITGKMFEYLRAKRPVLLIAPPKGDAAHVLKQCHAGEVVGFDDDALLEKSVLKLYNAYLKGENTVNSSGVEQFSGTELTRKYAELLDGV
jgi:hypothetical protein